MITHGDLVYVPATGHFGKVIDIRYKEKESIFFIRFNHGQWWYKTNSISKVVEIK